jgi:hypothetical protein
MACLSTAKYNFFRQERVSVGRVGRIGIYEFIWYECI